MRMLPACRLAFVAGLALLAVGRVETPVSAQPAPFQMDGGAAPAPSRPSAPAPGRATPQFEPGQQAPVYGGASSQAPGPVVIPQAAPYPGGRPASSPAPLAAPAPARPQAPAAQSAPAAPSRSAAPFSFDAPPPAATAPSNAGATRPAGNSAQPRSPIAIEPPGTQPVYQGDGLSIGSPLRAAPRGASPFDEPDPGVDFGSAGGGGRPSVVLPVGAPSPQAAAVVAPALPPANPAIDRFVAPSSDRRLTGEIDSQTWTAYLSESEVAKPARFSVGFVNAVLVVPEVSRLRVYINGRAIMVTALSAPEQPVQVTAEVPAGVLVPGPNRIRVEVSQRHRVDCSVDATYELWTRIEPRYTGFSFSGGRVPVLRLADLPSVGVDDTGATRIRVLRSEGLDNDMAARLLKVAQAIAIRGRFDHPVIEVVSPGDRTPARPGMMNVVLAPASMLPSLMATPPSDASVRPVAVLRNDPVTGFPTLVLSGPAWPDVDVAAERFQVAAFDAERDTARGTRLWRSPDIPTFTGDQTVTLAELGVLTEEFSGRRYQTAFEIRLPSDFYAAAYGVAELRLDAAYSAEVLPSSRIDVYVNDSLTVTVPITGRRGGLFQQWPVRMVMRHFRPGVNEVRIEAVLKTEADEVCLPGATMLGKGRFALFNTSQLSFPDFGRIGRLPNLAAFAASGFPYDEFRQTLAVQTAVDEPSTLGSAATILARMAISRGQVFPTDLTQNAADLFNRSALLVGAMPFLAPSVMAQMGLSEDLRTRWTGPVSEDPARAASDRFSAMIDRLRKANADAQPPAINAVRPAINPDLALGDSSATRDLYAQWRTTLTEGSWFGRLRQSFMDWFQQNLDATLRTIALSGTLSQQIDFSTRALILFAQAPAPSGSNQLWTLVTAPTPALLAEGVETVTAANVWVRLDSRAAAYRADTDSFQTFHTNDVFFIPTAPLSFINMRLIAANWFSINVLFYAAGLLVTCVLLGASTWALVRRMGRHT
ncbi:cellulose biosynthesis cyclic di-GMP-binding regulatory protein BcsB [Segnochrobactraceae bacterium EtOH-i3]